MKKISTIILIAGLSSFVFAQKGNAFSDSYNNNNRGADQENAAGDPPTDGTGGTDTPIDDYIPLLAAAGLGMAVYFGRKKYILTNK